MSKHRETGARGERIAEEFLVTNGYVILHRNWRHAQKEIDLIALDGEVVVFIEIKTRSGTHYGLPEEAVTAAKQSHLRSAAEKFSLLHPEYEHFRFDVVGIIMKEDVVLTLEHIKDAF